MNQGTHDFFVFELDIIFDKIIYFKQIFVDLFDLL